MRTTLGGVARKSRVFNARGRALIGYWRAPVRSGQTVAGYDMYLLDKETSIYRPKKSTYNGQGRAVSEQGRALIDQGRTIDQGRAVIKDKNLWIKMDIY